MFDRQKKGERAILVIPYEHGENDPAGRCAEFTELARSAGAEVFGTVCAHLERPNPRYYIGSGKVDEVASMVRACKADLVLVDQMLGPVQERNLEKQLNLRVVDRAGLILDIFAQRARSREGKLEVELAQLRHMATRAVRGWSHLDTQRGGAIGNRGPGETQLETDRRLLDERVRRLTRRLQKVQTQRGQQRRARIRNRLPRIALVGYTNAGKSTLFNALTGDAVYAANQLFATLDPTVRRLDGFSCGPVLLADTVGFVRDLPHDLIAAFRGTLAEARDANLLLHVMDASDEMRAWRMAVVNQVLEEIGAGDLPQLRVINKIDMLRADNRTDRAQTPVMAPDADTGMVPRMDCDEEGQPHTVWLSAALGHGLTLLKKALARRLSTDRVRAELRLPFCAGRLHARLRVAGAIADERVDEMGWWLRIDAPRNVIAALSTCRDARAVLLQTLPVDSPIHQMVPD